MPYPCKRSLCCVCPFFFFFSVPLNSHLNLACRQPHLLAIVLSQAKRSSPSPYLPPRPSILLPRKACCMQAVDAQVRHMPETLYLFPRVFFLMVAPCVSLFRSLSFSLNSNLAIFIPCHFLSDGCFGPDWFPGIPDACILCGSGSGCGYRLKIFW